MTRLVTDYLALPEVQFMVHHWLAMLVLFSIFCAIIWLTNKNRWTL